MSTKTFNLSLPTKLMSLLDAKAKADFSTRSDFIKRSIINQLKSEQNIGNLFDTSNAKGKKLGFKSEQQIYDIIAKS
jgi:metal-responsive CopG/Arc/MetJ family transcriptional regulator